MLTIRWFICNCKYWRKDIKDVEVGKDVDVTIDGQKASVKGKVDSIGKATAASFSLMPSSNSDGNYT